MDRHGRELGLHQNRQPNPIKMRTVPGAWFEVPASLGSLKRHMHMGNVTRILLTGNEKTWVSSYFRSADEHR